VRTHATNRVGKTSLKNCQILENLLEISRFPSPILRFPSPISRFDSPKIQLSSHEIQFSSHEIRFSPIGFLLSSTAFRFLQRLPLSSTAFQFSSTAFRFPRNPRQSIYGGKYMNDHYSSFVFPATCSPSFVIPATMPTSHPTHSCGAPVFPTVHQI
jgi:hypothetical protein